MNLGQLVKKTISFSARGYFICMALGMLTLILSTSNGHPYAVNWDIVGFSSTMQTMVRLVLATITGDIFRDPELFTVMVIAALVLLGLIKAFLVGPKPWSKTKLLFVFLLTYVVGGAVVVVVTMFLPYEAYYVFPDDYTVGFLSMMFSELLGVVSMIPEIIMVSALVAYLRIRKSQDDDVAEALDEIESPTLKRQLGFAKS